MFPVSIFMVASNYLFFSYCSLKNDQTHQKHMHSNLHALGYNMYPPCHLHVSGPIHHSHLNNNKNEY